MCVPTVAVILNVFRRSNSTEKKKSLGKNQQSYIFVNDDKVLEKVPVDLWVVAYMGNWSCQSLSTSVRLNESGKKSFFIHKILFFYVKYRLSNTTCRQSKH